MLSLAGVFLYLPCRVLMISDPVFADAFFDFAFVTENGRCGIFVFRMETSLSFLVNFRFRIKTTWHFQLNENDKGVGQKL